MTTQQVVLVKSEDIPDIWYSLKPLFEEALDHSTGELLPADLLKQLLNEREYLNLYLMYLKLLFSQFLKTFWI